MREGAWINIATCKFEWITEHCDWIKLPQNAAKIVYRTAFFSKSRTWQTITPVPNAKKFFGL